MRGYAMVAVAACSWGTWRFVLLAAEKLAPGLDARVEGAIVMLVITLFAFAVMPFEKREPRARTMRDWAGVAWLGVADALNVLLLFVAYAKTSVAIAVTTHYLAPIFVAIGAPIFLREEEKRGARLAAFGGLVGLALLLRPWSSELRASDMLGAAAGAASAVFYASNVLVNKTLVRKFTPIELMAWHGVFATPLLFFIAPAHEFGKLTLGGAAFLTLGGIGPGALGGIFFIWALKEIRAADAATLTLLEPLVAVGIAVLAFGEHLAAISWLGASIILICA
ncbi:MAG TPA: DMT family transporter, partial [Polyangiaceae bacterium]